MSEDDPLGFLSDTAQVPCFYPAQRFGLAAAAATGLFALYRTRNPVKMLKYSLAGYAVAAPWQWSHCRNKHQEDRMKAKLFIESQSVRVGSKDIVDQVHQEFQGGKKD
jgi:hypothetical protein